MHVAKLFETRATSKSSPATLHGLALIGAPVNPVGCVSAVRTPSDGDGGDLAQRPATDVLLMPKRQNTPQASAITGAVHPKP